MWRAARAWALLACLTPCMTLVINFTGNVPADFPAGPGVFIAQDGIGDVGWFTVGGIFGPTGFDINDARFAWDAASDTAYFGGCMLRCSCVKGGGGMGAGGQEAAARGSCRKAGCAFICYGPSRVQTVTPPRSVPSPAHVPAAPHSPPPALLPMHLATMCYPYPARDRGWLAGRGVRFRLLNIYEYNMWWGRKQ